MLSMSRPPPQVSEDPHSRKWMGDGGGGGGGGCGGEVEVEVEDQI